MELLKDSIKSTEERPALDEPSFNKVLEERRKKKLTNG